MPENSFLSNLFMSLDNQPNRIQVGPEIITGSRIGELTLAKDLVLDLPETTDAPHNPNMFKPIYQKPESQPPQLTVVRPANQPSLESGTPATNQIRASLDNIYREQEAA